MKLGHNATASEATLPYSSRMRPLSNDFPLSPSCSLLLLQSQLTTAEGGESILHEWKPRVKLKLEVKSPSQKSGHASINVSLVDVILVSLKLIAWTLLPC